MRIQADKNPNPFGVIFMRLLVAFLALFFLAPCQESGGFFPKKGDSRQWTVGGSTFDGVFKLRDEKQVTFECRDRIDKKVPFTSLSEEDQNVIRCFSSHRTDPSTEVILGDVVDVLDGDTIQFKSIFNDTFSVRLSDVDAPEAKQPFGLDARNKLRELTLNRAVSAARIEWKTADKYGRLLGTVFVENVDVNRSMVDAGLAWNYIKHSKRPELSTAERHAQEKKLGLWSEKSPEPPWEFRDRISIEQQAAANKQKMDRLDNAKEKNQVEVAEDPVVYVTKSGKKYHSKGCQHLSKSHNEIRLSRARSAYDPCEHCHPPH